MEMDGNGTSEPPKRPLMALSGRGGALSGIHVESMYRVWLSK